MKTLKNIVTIFALAIFLLSTITLKAQDNSEWNKLGIYHNELVKSLMEPLVIYKNKNKKSDIKYEIKRKVLNYLQNSPKFNKKFNKSDIKNAVNSIPDFIFDNKGYMDLLNRIKTFGNLSNKLISYVKKDIEVVEKSKSVNDIENYITNQLYKNKDLTFDEKKSYKAFLITLQSSVEYWYKTYPTIKKSKGGPNGLYEEIAFNMPWPFPGCDIVVDDALGGLAGAMGGLVGALVWGGAASMSTALHDMFD